MCISMDIKTLGFYLEHFGDITFVELIKKLKLIENN